MNRLADKSAVQLLAVLLLGWLLQACTPGGRSPNPTGVRQGEWAQAEGDHGGKKLLYAFRETYSDEQRKGKSRLLIVSRHVEKTDDVGQPTREELARLDEMERRVVPALEKDGKAALVAVVTIDHQHDWYFYVEDARAARATVLQLLGPEEKGLVSVLDESDPNGEFYVSVRKRSG